MANNNIPVDIEFVLKNMNFQAETAKMKQGIKGVTNTVDKEAQRMNSIFRNLATGIGVYFSAGFLKDFVRDIANVRGEFQQLEVAFQTILKSKSEADKLMDQVVDFAAKTPFELTDVAKGTKQLLAYGFAADDVIGTLRTLGDVAAGVSAPIGDIIYLYGTLRTQGRAYTRDIMQFTSRGIPIIRELANQFGIAEAEVQKLVEAGKVGFKDVEAALQNMTTQGGMFANLMQEQSKTITGLASNFQDAWDRMLNSIGEANEGVMADAIKAATNLVDNYEKVIDVIKTIIYTYGAYKAATIAAALLREAEAAGSLTRALRQTAVAQRLLNAAQRANPAGIAIAAITAIIGAYQLWAKHTKEVNSFTGDLNATISEEVIKLDSLFNKLKSTQEGTEERADAIKITNDRYGSYLENLLTEKSSLEDIEVAQRNATNALIANIAVQKSQTKLGEVLGDVSDKFDKEFSDFIGKFGEVYGTDRIPEFVVAINDAIDEKIKQGGGKVERGLLEYSNIAKEVYDKFIADISRRTGYLQYGFDDFQESFLDFAEFKADKSGFIQQLEGMIDAYQGMIDKVNQKKTGPGSEGIDEDEVKTYSQQLKEKEDEYKAYSDALRQHGKKWADENFELLLKDGQNWKEYLENQVKEFSDSRERMIAIAQAAQKSGFTLFQPEMNTIESFTKAQIVPKTPPVLDTKTLASLDKWYEKLQKRLDKLNAEFNEDEQKEFGRELAETAMMFDQIGYRVGEIDAELGVFIKNLGQAIGDASNLVTGISTGNAFQAFSGAAGLLMGAVKMLVNDNSEEATANNLDRIAKSISRTNALLDYQLNVLSDLEGASWFDAAVESLRDLNGRLSTTKRDLQAISVWRKGQARLGKIDTSDWTPQDWLQALESGRYSLDGMEEGARNLISQWIDLMDKISTIENEQRFRTLGFTYEDVTSNIADAIFEGLKLGESGLGDFAESFGQLMESYGKKALEQFLNDKFLTDFYAKAYELASDEDGLTKEDREELARVYREMIEGAQGFYESIRDVVAVDESSPEGLTGAIKGITEETAGMIAGNLMGIRYDMKSILSAITANNEDVVQRQLAYMAEVAANTRHNAKLNDIDDRLREMNLYLKNI
jgi:tape measure domain-containing protein